MKFLWSILLICSAEAKAIDLKAIEDHFREAKELRAEIEQTKSSPLLIRPLRSKILLEFKDEILSWQVDGQKPWRIRFADDKAEFLDASKTLSEIPPEAKAKLDRTLSLVRKILVMDKSLSKDFEQVLKGDRLAVIPRSRASSVFFESIEVRFKGNADIRSILLKSADEETDLRFISFQLIKQ